LPFLFIIGGALSSFADEQNADAKQKPVIDQIVGIEIDAGFPILYRFGSRDMMFEGTLSSSTIGFSTIIDIIPFLGAGFYSKFFLPHEIYSKSERWRGDFITGEDFSEGDIWLFDMLFGPVFTYPSSNSPVQLKLAFGRHISLLHFDVSDPGYRKYNTEEYYRKYTGFGGNVTLQAYFSFKFYIYLRLQYGYGRHSGYERITAFGSSMGFGISLPNLFKSFPDKEKQAEEESASADG
jgi:hypothetical protein